MKKKSEIASPEGRYLSDIQNHIEKHIGKSDIVLHEIVSESVHVDVHVIQPTKAIPYITLVTSGMSDKDMNVPDAAKPKADFELAEMISFLPPDWPVEDFSSNGESLEDNPSGYYPIYWVKHYARKVHQQKMAMSWYSTTANGNPASSIGVGTDMTGFLFAPAIILAKDAMFIETSDNRKIRLLNLVPILPDEIEYAIKRGGMALCEKLDKPDKFIFDPCRKSIFVTNPHKKFLGIF
jgi:Suppressor of fused protein (SUFU)